MSKNTVYKFSREHIKQSDMISGYGAGEELVKKQLKKDLKEMYFDGVEKIFYQAQDNVTPMVSVLKETFQSIWDDTRTQYSWTLPDYFVTDLRPIETVEITVNPFGQMTIKLVAKAIVPSSRNTRLGVSIIHSVDGYVARELVSRCNYDLDKCLSMLVKIDEFLMLNPDHQDSKPHAIGGIISHTVIESLAKLSDDYLEPYSATELRKMRAHLINVLNNESFPIKPIHDGFGCHPNYDTIMARHYSNIMADIAGGHLLESIVEEITGKKMQRIVGDLTEEMVRENSFYALS